MAALECASTYQICAVRATRLASDGTVSPDTDNVYIVNDILQLQMTPNIREGEDREMPGGCGCIIASASEDDSFRRFDLELQAGRLEPGLIEMMTGATVIENTDGPIGLFGGAKRACGTPQPRVAFEAWSKRWTADDEWDPDWPWWHWIWVATKWQLGQNTLQPDFGPIVLTGKSGVNTAWADGPYGDQPADATDNQWGVWADANELPAGTCAYSNVGT